MSDQLAQHPVRIAECYEALIVEASFRMLELHVVPDEPLDPESDRGWQNSE